MKKTTLQSMFLIAWLEMKRGLFGTKYIAEIDVTDNCNLRCKHCYHFFSKEGFSKKEIPIGEWERRFDELHRNGVRFVLLVGGEPALRNDVLMLAQSIFPHTSVITNGTIKIPKEFNGRLVVSIDGKEKTNDSIRGKGVFSRVIDNFSGDSRVIINMTAMEDNYKELEDVIKVSKEHGFSGVICNIFAPGIEYKGSMSMKMDLRRRIIKELKRVKSMYPNDLLLSKSMIKWYEYPDHRDHCYWGDNTLHLDVSWKKRRCFTKPDCANCGCFAGTIENPLKFIFHPKEAIKIMSV